jgi:hypothetical protein
VRKFFVSQSLVEVELLKELLEQAGILCTIKNQQASTLAGAVPFAEVFPELWVLRDEDYDQAKMLLEDRPKDLEPAQRPWTCAGCGESHTDEFTACWKCGWKKDSNSGAAHKSDHETEETLHKRSSNFELLVGILLGMGLTAVTYVLWNYFSLSGTPYDRNADGKDDVVYEYNGRVPRSAKFDNNFDGFFETLAIYNRDGDVIRTEIDRNRDGKPDVIEYNTLGKLDSVEIIEPGTGKVRKRMYYKLDVKVREEIDQDGDGLFEKVIKFDEYENPLP